MKGCIFLKNVQDQLAGYQRINRDPRSLIFLQAYCLFQNDQCSCPCFSHLKTGLYQFSDGAVCQRLFYFPAVVKRHDGCQQVILTQLFQGPAKFRLKYYNDRHDSKTEEVLGDPQYRVHMEHICQNQQCKQNRRSFHQTPGTG